ncbi:SEC-C metal-binding domain-containing protein [Paenibacillus lacisoli]
MSNLRNQPCPCGSGKKYKNCCINGDSNIDRVPPYSEQENVYLLLL